MLRKRFINALLTGVYLAVGFVGVTAPAIAAAAPAVPAPVVQSDSPAMPSLAAGMPTLDMAAAKTAKGVVAPKGAPNATAHSPAKVLTVCPGGICYEYAGGKQTVGSDGYAVNVSIENPAITASDAYHSLAELAVQDGSGNIVEVGWTKDTAVCGVSGGPCLFVFNWVGGVAGCYNGCGVVPVTGCGTLCPGASLTSLIGTTKSFAIQYLPTASPAGWYIAVDGAWRAAIPETDWTGSGASFTRGTLNQTFGELALKNLAPSQCSDMGSGVLATGSPTLLGAKLNSYTLVNGSAAASLTAFATTPAKWASFTTASGLSVRYGGPGWC